jgi:putative tryptophan/tyrosine transport system substrate-binding protein
MKRREFIMLLGGAAVWPLAARAQTAIPTVGFLFAGRPEENNEEVNALLRGMSETGFVEGRNVMVEYRWSANDPGRTQEQAADLVSRRVAVIATNVSGAALRAKATTTTTPIVFVANADAVQVGLVTNLARPGGNVTGINTMMKELEQKRFGLLHELAPQALRYGILAPSAVPGFESEIASAQSAAKTLGLSLEVFTAATRQEIDDAFARAVQQRVEALAIAVSQTFVDRRIQLVTLTVRHGLPTMFFSGKFAEVGGLMSYSPNAIDVFHQAGIYVGRILKGEKPGDLPVMQPTKFEFVINMQTARALGINVPPAVLAIADKVIE